MKTTKKPPLSPVMEKYISLRSTLPKETLLAFRLGYFYEIFFEDAKLAATAMGVALTKRNGVPMCGFPFHAAEKYIRSLVNAGLKVAMCEDGESVVSTETNIAGERHTPGPWRIAAMPIYPHGDDWRTDVHGKDRFVGCVTQSDAKPIGEANANARLIAAAPDLLVAAKAALLVIPDEAVKTLEMLEAAIKKAQP